MCNWKMPEESERLKSRLVGSRNIGEKLWEREGKVLRRKQWKQKAKPMNLVPFDHNSCEWHVFLKLKLLCFLEECGSLRARWLSNHSLWTHESTYFLYLWSHSWCMNQMVFKKVEFFNNLYFRTEPESHSSIPRFQFFSFPTNLSGSAMNRPGSAAQSGSEMNRSGSLRTYTSQKKMHKCFVSASGRLLVISVTISQAV